MNIYRIAFNNLKRRKVKMLLNMCGLVVGIAAAVAMFMIVQAMRLDLGKQIDEFGANLVILPRSEGMDLNYEGTHITRVSFDQEQLTEKDLDGIARIADSASINIVSPKMAAAVKADGKDILILGVNPRQEFAMKPWLTLREQEGVAPGQQPTDPVLLELSNDEVLLGSGAARTLAAAPGDLLNVNGNAFRVGGILEETGAEEDGLIYANLTAVQVMLERPGEFSMIEIAAYCNACPIEEIAAQLTEALPHGKIIPLRQAAMLRAETIDTFSVFAVILSSVALGTAALLVLTTMIASVNERTREIGIFRAIGFRRAHILQIILSEAAVIGLVGGLSGYLVGGITARTAGQLLARINGAIPWQHELALPAALLALAIAVLASIYPAYKAARMDPVEALRFI